MTVYYKELTVEAPSRLSLRTIVRMAPVKLYEPSLLARFFRVIGRFVAAEWKWLIGIAVAIVGLVVKFHG
jgi:hypothetical protein